MEGHRWQRTLDAITRIHRAGSAPETWPAALEAVATALDAGKAVMFGVDLRDGRVSDLRTHNIDGDATDRFAAYYHRLDPWLQGFGTEQRPREPIPGTRIISDAALRRTEYYNDFIKPLDMRFALTGFLVKTAQWTDLLTVFRGVRQKDFDAESLQVYQVLLEHTAQAMDVQRTVGGLQARSNGLAAGLAGGATVTEIAARQDIAVDTARKRLKAVFEKTRTHRQAELVQRVLSDFGEL